MLESPPFCILALSDRQKLYPSPRTAITNPLCPHPPPNAASWLRPWFDHVTAKSVCKIWPAYTYVHTIRSVILCCKCTYFALCSIISWSMHVAYATTLHTDYKSAAVKQQKRYCLVWHHSEYYDITTEWYVTLCTKPPRYSETPTPWGVSAPF